MLSIECPHCHRRIDEAHVDWDKAQGNGRCPKCGHFYDRDAEMRADMALAADPGRAAYINRMRVLAIVTGILLIPISVVLMLSIRHFAFAVMALAASIIGWGIYHTPRQDAREAQSSRTDLRKLAGRD